MSSSKTMFRRCRSQYCYAEETLGDSFNYFIPSQETTGFKTHRSCVCNTGTLLAEPLERMNANLHMVTTAVYKYYKLACGKTANGHISYQNSGENTEYNTPCYLRL